GERVGVRADGHPRRAADRVDVLVAHRGDEDAGLAAVGDDEVAHGVEGIDAATTGDRAERATGLVGQIRRHGHTHDVPRRNPAEVVEAIAGDVGAQTLAHVGATQALEHRGNPTVHHPAGEEVAQRVAGRVVRVRIAVHGEPAPARDGDLVQQPRGAAPVVDAGELQVRDLYVHPRCFGDGDRLAHRVRDVVRLVTDVR